MATIKAEHGILDYADHRAGVFRFLRVWYLGHIGYGIHASITGALAIVVTAGQNFAHIWGGLIAIFAALAVLGTHLSRRYNRPWIEILSTTLLIGLLVGYTVSIILLAMEYNVAQRYPSAWLPIIMSLVPGWRLSQIARGGSLFHRRKKG